MKRLNLKLSPEAEQPEAIKVRSVHGSTNQIRWFESNPKPQKHMLRSSSGRTLGSSYKPCGMNASKASASSSLSQIAMDLRSIRAVRAAAGRP